MKKHVIITGVLGGIGSGLAKAFSEGGYFVIGLDVKNAPSPFCDDFLQFDLHKFCTDELYRMKMEGELTIRVPHLNVLINNAAIQLLGSVDEIKLDDSEN